MTTTASYLAYPSSIEPGLSLCASFAPAARPSPLLLAMHGWHGAVKDGHADNVPVPPSPFFVVQPEMRGRGDSGGRPDANGLELQDAIDALGAAAALFPGRAARGRAPLEGGSGGGSNVLGILGKFPDLFAAAVCQCGVSDFALWSAHDAVGEFRDEMEGKGWIGGSPQTNPEGYLARGGRTTAMNLLTPLLMYHGEIDPRVPVEQARAYAAAAEAHGRGHLVRAVYYPGVGHPGHFGGLAPKENTRREQGIAAHLTSHTRAPALPESGRLVVAGYVRTRRFAVDLGSAGWVAILDYDLGPGEFRLRAPTCRAARLSLAGSGEPRRMECEPIPLDGLCREIGVPHPAEPRGAG